MELHLWGDEVMATPFPEKRKPVLGLVFRCGYAETGLVGTVIVYHLEGGFDTIEEALRHFANYLMENLIYSYEEEAKWAKEKPRLPRLEDFGFYLDRLAGMDASASDVWDHAHTNGEEWWPWDSLSDVYPFLEYFWELPDSAGETLFSFLDPDKIPIPELAEEVREVQKPSDDEWQEKMRASRRDASKILPVPVKARKTQEEFEEARKRLMLLQEG